MSTVPAANIDHRRRMLRRMAQACVVLLLLVVVSSAFMRHRLAGVGCEEWPACYGQEQDGVRTGNALAIDQDVALVRLVHRSVASLTLVLAIVMLLGSLAMRPALRREGALAACLVVLALALALLGAASTGSRSPAVTLGNLVGGFAMLALCARLAAVAGTAPGRQRDAPLGRVAIVVGLLLFMQVALGALVSANHALPGAPIHLVHRLGAVLAGVAVLALGLLAWHSGHRRSALALAGLLLPVVALGLLIGTGSVTMPAVLLHNLGAAGLLALVLRLA